MKENKYLEYINKKFVLEKANNNIKKINIFVMFLSTVSLNSKIQNICDNVFKLTTFNFLDQKIALFLVRPSGIYGNQKKRIQIYKNQLYEKDIIPIAIYCSGNSFCYIKFGNNTFLNNSSKENRSIWINFSLIVVCLKSNLKIKYFFKGREESYYIYFSTNAKDLFFESDFIEINDNHLKSLDSLIKDTFDHYECNVKNKIVEKDEKTNIFKIRKKAKNNIKHINDSKKEEIGRLAEEYFNSLLKNNDISVLEKLGIGNIIKYEWSNENKESYKPYDFYVNDEIYIDVKGTPDPSIYFNLSENEREFSHSINEKGYKYFVVNIYNMIDGYNKKIKIIPFEDIDKYYFDIKQTYVYRQEKDD